MQTRYFSRWGWWLIVGTTVACLAWLTLRPHGYFVGTKVNLVPLAEHGWAATCLIENSCLSPRRTLQFLMVDVIGNIVVFVPLGFGLAGAMRQIRVHHTFTLAVLGGFGLSLLIELSQLIIPSRTADVDDLIFNTLGAMLGALLFLSSKIFSPSFGRE